MRASNHKLGVALLVTGLLGLAGLAGCRKPEAPPAPPSPVVARVDGAPILLSTLQREVTRVRRGEDPAGGDAGTAQSTEAPKEIARAVLGPLIDRQILAARARADGLTVSDADVQRATDALAEDAQKAGQSFGERLAQDGETAAGLQDSTRERLLAERAIARDVHVELPTPQDIKAWAEAQKSELSQPEQVHAAQILVATPEEGKSLLDQLRVGARFDVLAREHSLSPDAKAGGDLGFFARGTMPPPFDEVCFSLKPGQLSGVVRSSYGFHIFKLLEKRPAHHRSLEEVAPSIGARLIRERQSAAEAALLAGLRAKAQVTIDEGVLAQVQ